MAEKKGNGKKKILAPGPKKMWGEKAISVTKHVRYSQTPEGQIRRRTRQEINDGKRKFAKSGFASDTDLFARILFLAQYTLTK